MKNPRSKEKRTFLCFSRRLTSIPEVNRLGVTDLWQSETETITLK